MLSTCYLFLSLFLSGSRFSLRSESMKSSPPTKATVCSTVIPSSRFQRSGDQFRDALNVSDNRELPMDMNRLPSNDLWEQNGKNSNRYTTKSIIAKPQMIAIAIGSESFVIRSDQNVFETLFREKSLSRSNNPKCVRFFHFSSGVLRHSRRSIRNKVMRGDEVYIDEKANSSSKRDCINVCDKIRGSVEPTPCSLDSAWMELRESNSNTQHDALETNRKRTRDSHFSVGCIQRGRAFDEKEQSPDRKKATIDHATLDKFLWHKNSNSLERNGLMNRKVK